MAENEGSPSIPGTGPVELNPVVQSGGDSGGEPNQSIMSSSGDQNQSTPGVEYGPNQSTNPPGDGYTGPPDLPIQPDPVGNALLGGGAEAALGSTIGEIAANEAVIAAGEAIVDKIKQPKGKNIDNNN